MKKSLTSSAGIIAIGISTMFASTALAAANPSGTGQPSQECGSTTAFDSPGHASTAPGSAFNEDGKAGSVYAGSGISATKANSPHAVSQYDAACYQVTTNQQ